jgi:hypothetical protein
MITHKTTAGALLAFLPVILGARPAAASDLTVMDNSKTLTHACSGSDTVAVMGNSNTLSVTGTCGAVNVTGNSNHLAIAAAATIQVMGNDNSVTWQRGAGAEPPRVQNLGRGNTVKKAGGPAAPADRPKAPPAAPSAPAKPMGALKPMEPVKCNRGTVRVENASIQTDGDGIEAHGACHVVVVGSRIAAGRTAISVHGSGSVEIRNSQVEGKVAAVDIHGKAALNASGTTFVGPKEVHGGGQIVDGGGNAWR